MDTSRSFGIWEAKSDASRNKESHDRVLLAIFLKVTRDCPCVLLSTVIFVRARNAGGLKCNYSELEQVSRMLTKCSWSMLRLNSAKLGLDKAK